MSYFFRLKVALLDISCSWSCYAGSDHGAANNYCCDWNQRFVCWVCTGSTERINRTDSSLLHAFKTSCSYGVKCCNLAWFAKCYNRTLNLFFADQWLDLVLPVMDCLCFLQIGSTFMYVSTICQFVFLCKLARGLMYVPRNLSICVCKLQTLQ